MVRRRGRPDHLVERRDAASEIIERAVEVGDVGVEALGRRLLVQAMFEAGDLGNGEVEVSRFERASTRLGRAEYMWYRRCGALRWRSRAAKCRRGHALALNSMQSSVCFAARTASCWPGLQQGMMALDLADANLAGESLREVRVMEAVEVVQAEVIAALVRAFTGDLDQARASLDRWAGAALAADLDSAWPGLMMNLADLVVTVGGHPAADTVRRAIEPFGVVWVVAGIGAAIRGPLDRPLGSLAALDGDLDAADAHFSAAHEAALRTGAILVAAIVDQEGGRALGDCSRLNRAGDVWRRVGATRRVAQIEVLTRSLTPGRATPADLGNRFVRDGDVWSITFDGESCAVTDRKGLRDLARLLAEPGREIAAQDLMATGGTVIDSGGGRVIDDQARDAYRARLVEIAALLDKADAAGDYEGSAGLAAEQEALIAELRGAYGLGGHPRRPGASAERARTAVRSRIRDALQRIEVAHPGLGRHLRHCVRTGSYCVYQPDPPADWTAGEAPHTV